LPFLVTDSLNEFSRMHVYEYCRPFCNYSENVSDNKMYSDEKIIYTKHDCSDVSMKANATMEFIIIMTAY
jgi:hypothetical protein